MGKVVRIKTDNEAVATIVNTGRSNDEMLQSQLRELTWWLAIYQMRVKTVHLMGKLNRLPDLLSRFHEGESIVNEFKYLTRHREMKFRSVKMDWFRFTNNW